MESIYNDEFCVTSESFAGYDRMSYLMDEIDNLLQVSHDNGYDITGVESELVAAISGKVAEIKMRHGINQRRIKREQ